MVKAPGFWAEGAAGKRLVADVFPEERPGNEKRRRCKLEGNPGMSPAKILRESWPIVCRKIGLDETSERPTQCLEETPRNSRQFSEDAPDKFDSALVLEKTPEHHFKY